MKRASKFYVFMFLIGIINSCKSNKETIPFFEKNCDYSIITPFSQSDKVNLNLIGNVHKIITKEDTTIFDQEGTIINYPVFTEKDSIGRVITKMDFDDTTFYFSGDQYSGTSYQYDSNGRMVSEDIYYPEGGSTVIYGCIDGLPAYKVDYEYSLHVKKFDKKGFLIQEIEFEEDVERARYIYFRDSNNDIDRVESVKKSNYFFISDETVISHYKYNRDKMGNWIEMEIWKNGILVSREKRVIEYFK
jgi:hypothetical protein